MEKRREKRGEKYLQELEVIKDDEYEEKQELDEEEQDKKKETGSENQRKEQPSVRIKSCLPRHLPFLLTTERERKKRKKELDRATTHQGNERHTRTKKKQIEGKKKRKIDAEVSEEESREEQKYVDREKVKKDEI